MLKCSIVCYALDKESSVKLVAKYFFFIVKSKWKKFECALSTNIITHMTDKIHWQASAETLLATVSMNIKNQKAKGCIKKVPKVKKKVCVQGGD